MLCFIFPNWRLVTVSFSVNSHSFNLVWNINQFNQLHCGHLNQFLYSRKGVVYFFPLSGYALFHFPYLANTHGGGGGGFIPCIWQRPMISFSVFGEYAFSISTVGDYGHNWKRAKRPWALIKAFKYCLSRSETKKEQTPSLLSLGKNLYSAYSLNTLKELQIWISLQTQIYIWKKLYMNQGTIRGFFWLQKVNNLRQLYLICQELARRLPILVFKITKMLIPCLFMAEETLEPTGRATGRVHFLWNPLFSSGFKSSRLS
jgi:hypothetical protein